MLQRPRCKPDAPEITPCPGTNEDAGNNQHKELEKVTAIARTVVGCVSSKARQHGRFDRCIPRGVVCCWHEYWYDTLFCRYFSQRAKMNHDGPAPRIRLVLADDHDLVRSGIKALLSAIDGVEVVAEASDGSELIAAVDTFVPDVVMTDISMPGMDGITAISQIHVTHPEVRLLVLSMYDTVDLVKRAVASGACGYLMKDARAVELEQALHSVMKTGGYFSSSIAQLLLQPSEPTADDELTYRQVEILKLIARGLSSKEIAYELGLSSKTVDVHRSRIMDRLNLGDIASLTRYAVRKGLVKP